MARCGPAGIIAAAVAATTAAAAGLAALAGAPAAGAATAAPAAGTAATTACRAWTGHHPPFAVELSGVAALSPCDIWATGLPGQNPTASSPTDLLHWNGRRWSLITSADVPAPLDDLPSIAATSARDVWVASSLDNSSLQQLTLLAHWNGTAFTRADSPNPGGSLGADKLSGVAAISPANAWAVGLYSVYDPSTMTSVAYPLAEHWDGTAWTQVPAATPVTKYGNPTTYAEFSGVQALRCGCDTWAAGAWDQQTSTSNSQIFPLIERWNGRSWAQLPVPHLSGDNWLMAVSADSRDDAWAVGYHGSPSQTLAEHWNGRSWTVVPTPDPGFYTGKANGSLLGVAAISADNAWAVGYDWDSRTAPRGKQHALLLHWNGKRWKQINVPHYGPGYAPNVLMSVSASSAGNVIVGGYYSGVVGAGQQALVLRVG